MAAPTMYDPPRPGFGKASWISFVADKDTAETVEAYGYVFKEDTGDETHHAIIVDPRFDPNAVYDYLVELGATVVDLTTPAYP